MLMLPRPLIREDILRNLNSKGFTKVASKRDNKNVLCHLYPKVPTVGKKLPLKLLQGFFFLRLIACIWFHWTNSTFETRLRFRTHKIHDYFKLFDTA